MTTPPNILLIMSDQHSPHFLGCAGEGVVRTPTLDRLVAHGRSPDVCSVCRISNIKMLIRPRNQSLGELNATLC